MASAHDMPERGGLRASERTTGALEDAGVRLVRQDLGIPRAQLTPSQLSGFLLLAHEVSSIRPFVPPSRRRRGVLQQTIGLARQLRHTHGVCDAAVFRAILAAPGRGRLLTRRPHVHVARFDVVLLVVTNSVESAIALGESPLLQQRLQQSRAQAAYSLMLPMWNVRRIGPVDWSRQGVFLFNFFYADRPEHLIDVWENTAGWFMSKTGLDNSVVLAPAPGVRTDYGIINHARWDRTWDILPHLVLRPTFRSYVLANFEANDIAAMPLLYRLVSSTQFAP